MPDLFRFDLQPTHQVLFDLVGHGCEVTVTDGSDAIEVELGAFMRGDKGDQGDPGPGAGPIQTLIGIAGPTLGGHRVVGPQHDGTFSYIDPAVAFDALRTTGITTGAAASGAPVTVVTEGPITEPSWTWTADQPIYVGTSGTLTQTAPTGAAPFILQVGFALTATSMFVRRRDPIYLS